MVAALTRRLAGMIHDSPHVAVIEVTGAGMQGLAWLHAVAGSSRTILEATDRYSVAALSDALGEPPSPAVSVDVARRLAGIGRTRALELLVGGDGQSAVGVAATATIATGRPKRGRRGTALAVETGLGVLSISLGFDSPERSGLREHEEQVVSALLVGMLAEGCGIDALPVVCEALGGDAARVDEALILTPELASFLSGGVGEEALPIPAAGRGVPSNPLPSAGTLILSGAFNPWHHGHRALGAAAVAVAGVTKDDLWFELPITNADKAPLLPRETWRRAAQFAGAGNLLLSRAPLFQDKALLYPEATFVVGVDTAKRLLQSRFYGDSQVAMEAALGEIQDAGCRFLVAWRSELGGSGDGRGDTPPVPSAAPLCLDDLHIPRAFAEMFAPIPVESFRMDVSSTQIRGATADEWRALTVDCSGLQDTT